MQSSEAGVAAVRRDSFEATYGRPLESRMLAYSPTDQAGEFWLDVSKSQRPTTSPCAT
jgi:hypothetical protein